jgi:beta-glucosidase
VLGEEDLKFYDARLDHVAEPGEFEVQLGLDSQSVLSERFELL